MNDKPETGKRIRKKYRKNNIYVVLCDRSLTISMVDNDYDQRTVAGLDLIANLITALMEKGSSMSEIMECCLIPASRGKGDIAGILIDVVK